MAIALELRVSEKTLSISSNGKTDYKLNQSFYHCVESKDGNNKCQHSLNLSYRTKSKKAIQDEAESIYFFLADRRLASRVSVNFYPSIEVLKIALVAPRTIKFNIYG